jgi:hypothetical protein
MKVVSVCSQELNHSRHISGNASTFFRKATAPLPNTSEMGIYGGLWLDKIPERMAAAAIA